MSEKWKHKVDEVYKVDEYSIAGFFRDHRFMSNFHPARFLCKNMLWWESTEHFYQASKAVDTNTKLYIRDQSFEDVKKVARKLPLRKDWDQVKIPIMQEALVYKFTQNSDLLDLLLATGDKNLSEANWWRDTFWGTYNGEGNNALGKLLMSLRLRYTEHDCTSYSYVEPSNWKTL
jgi:ribA/ribD-fused uncharacterized protein